MRWRYNKKNRYLLQSTQARVLNNIMFQDFVVREQSSRFPSYLYTVYTLNMLEDTNGNLNERKDQTWRVRIMFVF